MRRTKSTDDRPIEITGASAMHLQLITEQRAHRASSSSSRTAWSVNRPAAEYQRLNFPPGFHPSPRLDSTHDPARTVRCVR